MHSAGFQIGAWAMQCGTCYAVTLAFGLEHKATIAAPAAILLAVNGTAVLPLTPSRIAVFQAIEIASALVLGVPALAHDALSPVRAAALSRRNLSPTADGHADDQTCAPP